MELKDARKKLDALTLSVHQQLEQFEQSTGLRIRTIEVERFEVTGVHSLRREDTLASLHIEASL